jgi:hypothetical protein
MNEVDIMTTKSNLFTLLLCCCALLLTPLAQADDFRSNFRGDHPKKDWRTSQDNRHSDQRFKRGNEDCGAGQDCARPNRKDNATTRSTDTPRLKRALIPSESKRTRRFERTERDRPALRVEKDRRDRPDTRFNKDHRDRPATRPGVPLRRDIKTHRPRPIATVKRHKHHITYSDRIRRDYRYIRGPWYNTRYIAPLPIRFHRIGYRRHTLPRSYVRIIIGGFPYFYYSGVFYRPYGASYIVVAAPIGAFVRTLPVGFIAFSIGLSTYYYVNDTYYAWDDNR